MKQATVRTALWNLFLAAAILCSIVPETRAVEVGQSLDIKFTALDGREVDLAEMKGKVVLIDFWATWCGPCVAELPNVKNVYQKLHSEGFEIIGISLDTNETSLRNYVSKENMSWPQHFDGKGWKNEIAVAHNVNSIPAMWLVDKSGKLADMNARGSSLESKVQKLLSETEQLQIKTFTATSAFAGDPVTLRWNVMLATTLNISPGIGNVSADTTSFNVTPDESTVYTLTASNESATVTASVRALVFPNPPEEIWPALQSAPSEAVDVFPLGSEWSYFHPQDGVDPVENDPDFYTTWMKATGYDGPGFKQSGQAILGYGTINRGGLSTNIGRPASGVRYTAYFKREFTVAQGVDLGLEMLSDDAAIVYIDGTEVVRTSNFSTPDAFHGLASRTGDESNTYLYGMGAMGSGTHTIAVSVHNANVTSSDIGFDLRLFSVARPNEFVNWTTDSGLANRPASEQAMDADPDEDGHPNLLEYALGGDPLTPDQNEFQQTSADSSMASVTFVRIKNSLDDAISYKVQLCPDLSSAWQDGMVKIEGASDGVDQSGLPDGKTESISRFERIRATFTQNPTTPLKQAFLRIVVSRE